MDVGIILADLFISLIGMGLLMYGKKEARVPHLAVGLILIIYPYFVGSPVAVVAIAALLLAALAVFSRLGY